MATAAELSGADAPDNLDSISFLPTLAHDESKQRQHEFLYWEFHEGGFKQAALYAGRWKGIRKGAPDAAIELFDLQQDIAEKNNLAQSNPEIANRISEYLQSARSDSPDWIPQWKDRP